MKLNLSEYDKSQMDALVPNEKHLQRIAGMFGLDLRVATEQVIPVPQIAPDQLVLSCQTCGATWTARVIASGRFESRCDIRKDEEPAEVGDWFGHEHDFNPEEQAYLVCPGGCNARGPVKSEAGE